MLIAIEMDSIYKAGRRDGAGIEEMTVQVGADLAIGFGKP